jgi:carbonic anhydrase
VPRAIELNVWQQVENLFTRSALVREFAAAGKVTIIGALYDITTGKVQWLGQHPEMDRLIADAKSQITQPDDHGVEPHAPVPIPAAKPAHAEAPAKAEPIKHSAVTAPAAAQTAHAAPARRVTQNRRPAPRSPTPIIESRAVAQTEPAAKFPIAAAFFRYAMCIV